jgi:uncharacterized protein (DUF305 family)
MNMPTRLIAAAAAVLALALVAGCGDDDDDGAADSAQTDGAFLTQMAVHHEAAIDMAETAQAHAQHAEIRALADDIIAAQSEEIGQMDAMHGRLFGGPMEGAGHGTLGMSSHEMGMDMDAMMGLEDAKPFDRAFIDAMIPHHQGAILMAQVVLERGSDGEIQELAEAIIAAQSREIEQMNEWRGRWYGARSPAGGVPAGGGMPAHDMMGH